jgi:hypothetical protein
MAGVKIFVSFEFDKDGDLKNNFYAQAKTQSSHRLMNSSLNEAYPDKSWQDKARSSIKQCDVLVILVGQDTHNASGVQTEVDIARRLKKPVMQVIPQGRPYTGLSGIDATVKWQWKRINPKIDELLTGSYKR